MGRITIFALTDCPHCKRAKAALNSRDIPYTEISLSSHPDKRNDMLSLSDRLTVPQIFFNDEHIGGADETLVLLAKWDDEKKYPSPLKRYQEEIESVTGPKDPRLSVPTTPPYVEKPAPPRDDRDNFIELPGKMKEKTSAFAITSALMTFMPRSHLPYLARIYKDCFTGKDGVTAIMSHYKLSSRSDAVKFGLELQKKKILHHVTEDHAFVDDEYYYRLQPYHQPKILNSFMVWTERVDSNSMALLGRLKKLLGKIESAATNDDGLVDYVAAKEDSSFLLFEEAACELQGVKMDSMDDSTKLAFGINLYNLMIKYAFMKVGIASSNLQRKAFFDNVAFSIGGDVLSFSELENGVMRANALAPFTIRAPFAKNDPRLRLALTKVDPRIHFALNCGATSCPPVKNFSSQSIDEELRVVAQAFCQQPDNVSVNKDTYELSLSMILKWYRADFADSLQMLPARVVTFLRGERKKTLQTMIDSGRPIKVTFNVYDWGTNASKSEAFHVGLVSSNEPKLLSLFSGLQV
eukprot:CAMPEP_0195522288 /NCGR_PEP_ID=MMETSP0794_2-20130614/20286_1 /TAXON_ID=515487 /ORGANISM="Stephanopyxis turris, Strain CCMP 815" /LENGTH=521 /DNA_ID=CAMNT_0040652007 /DNA_START=64 /DNA_END=1629 /DNA_ORIENTATION=+